MLDGNFITHERLVRPGVFPHETSETRVIETHISWVVLTGPFAYKIKKPVKFDFLDYSTYERRRQCCEKEYERNSPYAPSLYVGIVPICMENDELVFEGDGQPVEWAVKMHQFPQEALLSQRLKHAPLSSQEVRQLAETLTRYHVVAQPVTGKSNLAVAAQLEATIRDNAAYLKTHVDEDNQVLVELVCSWVDEQIDRVHSTIVQRIDSGLICRCHGDLHLNNLLFWQDQFMAFDAIEFNDELCEIDTLDELAFLVMDMDDQGHTKGARQLLNQYLEFSADYDGLVVFRLYLVHRALVRAKVALLQSMQNSTDQSAALGVEGKNYLAHAVRYSQPSPPKLFITHGLSGSGKSTGAREWVSEHGGIQLRSDIIRRTMAGGTFRGEFGEAAVERYSEHSMRRVYDHLEHYASTALDSGFSVVVDATFLKADLRRRFREIAADFDVDFGILRFEAPLPELKQRLLDRKVDASEATTDVLDKQLAMLEPLSPEEQELVVPQIETTP